MEGTAAAVGERVRGLLELRERRRRERGWAVVSGVLLLAFIGRGRELMRQVTAGNGQRH
jgi:hypothetical protein